jgi:hypothetical protein
MGATVESRSGVHLAWCGEHQDGLRSGSKAKAQAWADKHNAEKHKPLVDGR